MTGGDLEPYRQPVAGRLRLAVAFAVMLVMTLAMLPFHAIALALGGRPAAIAPRIWHRVMSRMIGFRVHVHGSMAKARPLMLVANHVSWTDILVLGSIGPVAFVAKADMKSWPGISWLAKLSSTIFVEREKRLKSREQAGEISARLKAGDAIILFAEGTTGDGNVLLPFKSSLLAAARDAVDHTPGGVVHIQPVALAYNRFHGMPAGRAGQVKVSWIGDQDLIPHLPDIVKAGARDVDVVIGEPIAFTAGSDRKAVTRELEARVRAMMVSAQRGTPNPSPD